jgi:hypothetical protein
MNELMNDPIVIVFSLVFIVLTFGAFFGMYFKLKHIAKKNDELLQLLKLNVSANSDKEIIKLKCDRCMSQVYTFNTGECECDCGRKIVFETK